MQGEVGGIPIMGRPHINLKFDKYCLNFSKIVAIDCPTNNAYDFLFSYTLNTLILIKYLNLAPFQLLIEHLFLLVPSLILPPWHLIRYAPARKGFFTGTFLSLVFWSLHSSPSPSYSLSSNVIFPNIPPKPHIPTAHNSTQVFPLCFSP